MLNKSINKMPCENYLFNGLRIELSEGKFIDFRLKS